MKIEGIAISAIKIGERLRALDPDWALLVAESMQDRGQDTPIVVRASDVTGEYELVAGLHRTEAARLLGWPTIQAKIFDGDDLQARLAEIDENLMRRELSELDRAAFLAEREKVWKALHPHTGKRGPKVLAKLGQNAAKPLADRFDKAVARKLGMSPRSIRRAIARFDYLAPDVRARLTGHPVADKGAQIDLLATLTPADQRRVCDALLQGDDPARTVAEAMKRLGIASRVARAPAAPSDDRAVARLKDLYFAASPEARRRFLAEIGASSAKAAA